MQRPKALMTFYEIVSGDEEAVLKNIMQITNSITGIIDTVQSFLTYWCVGLEWGGRGLWPQPLLLQWAGGGGCSLGQCYMRGVTSPY